ncbi:MAG TPA: protein kinase, partial [Polyangium sp.]|nr:protein kinase [Polyangium sp.]
IINAPLGWVHAELFALYLMAGCLAGYVKHVFGKGIWGLTRWLKRIFFLYAALAAIAVGTGLVPVLKTLLPAQFLLLFTTFSLTVQTVRGALAGVHEARIFSVGFVVASVAGAYDILGAMGVLSRANVPVGHLGIFVFTLSLGLILARRFLEVEERLGQYSTVLGLSMASARVLEPGQQAQVALDELLRLLKAQRALLFLTVPEGQPRAGELDLRAMRDASAPSATTRESVVGDDGLSLRTDVVERVRTQRKPLITSNAAGGKRRSAMAAPLLIRDELVGVVYLEADDSRRPFSDADLAVLLGLGAQLSMTIVSTRAVRLELQTALQKNRIEQQGALLDAASRLAKGDVETPIVVEKGSDLADLGSALDAMRVDVRAKIKMLETKNAEVQVLNDELRRKIEERTMTLLSALLDDRTQAPPPRLKRGSRIGDRYVVERKLGEGAMGVVYDVERTADGKHLAVKLLSTTKDKAALARFIREANLLARLDHPNLVSIFDVDVTADGHLYLVMEYFAGKTLEKFKDRDARWSLLALRQMAEGLAAVHASGIVHRDLKPSNVLVAVNDEGDPELKLADFGISTLAVDPEAALSALVEPQREQMGSIDDEARTVVFDKPPKNSKAAGDKANRSEPGGRQMNVTHTGAIVGTPSYMAPELGGREKAVRPSSDMFSLGIIAYELLVGERPFAVPPLYIVASGHPLERPEGLREVAGLSKTLVALFERCLSQDPTVRPTAPEVVDALRWDLDRGEAGTYRMSNAAKLKPA